MLAKFYSNVYKKIWRLISKKNVKAKDKFNIVTGQTEFRKVKIHRKTSAPKSFLIKL